MKKKQIWIVLALIIVLAFTAMLVSCSSSANEGDEIASGNNKTELSEKSDASIEFTPSTDRKIVKTCRISAESREFDDAVQKIKESVVDIGGYIQSENLNGNSISSEKALKRASFVIRVPSDRLDSFNQSIDMLINITDYSSNEEDIGNAYYDTEARLKTLKAERDSLVEMMKSLNTAEQYAFWGELQVRVSNLEQEIAVLEAKMRKYDNATEYSTVSLSLVEVRELTEKKEETFGDRVGKAFSESWVKFGKGWQDFAVFVVSALPTLLVLLVISAALFCSLFFPMRHAEKKRKKNNSDK